jgi:hypothetical protein
MFEVNSSISVIRGRRKMATKKKAKAKKKTAKKTAKKKKKR